MRDSADVIPLHQPPFSGKSSEKSKNQDTRPREYLTEEEVDRLVKAARSVGRHGFRDATLILLAYRHGLRVSELIALKWTQFDLKQGHLAGRESEERDELHASPAWTRDSGSQAPQARVWPKAPTSSSPSAEVRSRRLRSGK